MARPWEAGGGPDPAALRRLVEVENLTDRQIGARYNVTEASVRNWRTKAHIDRDSPERIDHRADGAIPWQLDASQNHHADPIARTLRIRNRMRHGLDVPAESRRRVLRLEKDLEDAGLVIDYSPELGFHTRRRVDSDAADSIVRMPQNHLV